MRFSIGAGDRQALQPPLSNTLPATKVAVAMLFKQLGKYFALRISDTCCFTFCAAFEPVMEHKMKPGKKYLYMY